MNTKQVIVIQKSLNMRKGKMVAQGAHASIAFLTKQFNGKKFINIQLSDVEQDWMKNSFTKICVSVDSEQELLDIHRAALAAGLESNLIIDSGLTEFGGVPTKTCCAIGPDESAKIDAITGGLKLL